MSYVNQTTTYAGETVIPPKAIYQNVPAGFNTAFNTNRTPDNLLTNTGFTRTNRDYTTWVLGTDPNTMWFQSNVALEGTYIVFDLGVTRQITKLVFWQYNQTGSTTDPVNSARIKDYTLTASNDPLILIDGNTNNKQDGTLAISPTLQTVNYSVTARYIRLDINSKHGTATNFNIGLGKFRVVARGANVFSQSSADLQAQFDLKESLYQGSILSSTTPARLDVPNRSLITGSTGMTTGQLLCSTFTPNRNFLVTNLSYNLVTQVSGGTLTLFKMGLYAVSISGSNTQITLLASTTSDTAQLTTTGIKTMALTAPYTVVKGQRYAVALLATNSVAWTTAPAYGRNSLINANIAALSPMLSGTISGQTDLPAGPSNLSSTSVIPYFGLT